VLFRLYQRAAVTTLGLAFASHAAHAEFRTEQTGTIWPGTVMCLTLAAAEEFDDDMTDRQSAQIGCLTAQHTIKVKAASEPIGDWQKVRILGVKDAVFGWVRTFSTHPDP